MKAEQIKIYLLLTTLFLTSGSIPLFSQNNRFQDLKGRRIAKAPEGEKAMLRRGGFLLAQADPKAGDDQEKAGDQAPAAQEKAPVEPAPAAPKAPAAPQAEEKPADEKAAEKPQAAGEKPLQNQRTRLRRKIPRHLQSNPKKKLPLTGKLPRPRPAPSPLRRVAKTSRSSLRTRNISTSVSIFTKARSHSMTSCVFSLTSPA